jgi:ubiquinone biosynthesis protein UbiJ
MKAIADNRAMLDACLAFITPAAQDRMILLLNHIVGREAQAMARLAPYAGCSLVLHLQSWPAQLPAVPDLLLAVTPAGLFEIAETAGDKAALLRIELDASNPALQFLSLLLGDRPRVNVQGDAGFAGEIHWLLDNLRWDATDDLASLIGAAPAHQLARWGRAVAEGLAGLAGTAAALRSRAASGRGAA